MFVFKKIVTPFLLPPGVFVSILLGAGLVLLLKKKGRPAFFCLMLGLLIWASATSPVSNAVIRPLESEFPLPGNPRGDVIILLSGGAVIGVPDLSGIGTPGGTTLSRMMTAVRLQRRLDVPILVSGGSVYGRGTPEALLIRRYLRDLGVPADRIIAEGNSQDTLENARFTAAICRNLGFRRPLLVTSAYHLRRAVWCFENAGLAVLPVPADIRAPQGVPYTWADFLPYGYDILRAALHEHLGLAFYRLQHRLERF